METKLKKRSNIIWFIVLFFLALLFLAPIFLIAINSFKGKLYISEDLFSLPNAQTFVGFENYIRGIETVDFWQAFAYSIFITVFSVGTIVLLTSMTAWFIVRVKNKFTTSLYYLFVFSMIVPFQMVMFTLTWFSNQLHLDNPLGIIFVYLGFGSGLSVFVFTGFIKSVPKEIEEAAIIDGCGPIRTFFLVVLPILKPTVITVAILNAMWIWNDYLLPYLLLGTEYKTIPVAIQYLQGSYGNTDYGALMALLVLAIIPVVIFYLSSQKHIIKSISSGAVKG
ncbi:L-arabinose transport system permease protein AraQ [Jeotgalibaca dankookensis]|uniref:L-arabinose transport system permease protein AraQ n=1 Tax=Jeotgalibaca dankookensis TaxID=708126 RepID=A0A1S6IPA4_9LACT|nr:carbohydrate ABC transporter permease [Jeotgalibaca dankookensis]AQS53392.1 L-arabinose transport system permease protein AraQ [Jeotgalibaca dankookensis]